MTLTRVVATTVTFSWRRAGRVSNRTYDLYARFRLGGHGFDMHVATLINFDVMPEWLVLADSDQDWTAAVDTPDALKCIGDALGQPTLPPLPD